MNYFTVISLLFCLLGLVFSQNLQFSHQAPYNNHVAVDLQVNGQSVEEFNSIEYGTVTKYVNISKYSLDSDEPGVFNLTVVVSGTSIALISGDFELSTTFPSSFFVVNTVDEALDAIVSTDQYQQPLQYYAYWRVADFAPVEEEFQLYVQSKPSAFEPLDVSLYEATIAGEYLFSVKSENGTVAKLSVTLTSGQVATIIFNGNSYYGETEYSLTANIDHTYQYGFCRARVVPAVADKTFNNLTVALQSEQSGINVLVSGLEYSEISSYFYVPIGQYTAFFTQNGTLDASATQVDFSCQDSKSYSLNYDGLPTSVSVQVIEDASTVPYINELVLQVVHLSASPEASPIVLYLNGQKIGTLSFPDTTGYIPVMEIPVNVTLTLEQGYVVLQKNLTDVSFASSYSLYVLGLAADEEYPLTAYLETDLTSSIVPSTTDSTTDEDDDDDVDDDDDDDDGLSAGAIVGIIFGVLIGVALIGLIAMFVLRRQRRAQFSTIG